MKILFAALGCLCFGLGAAGAFFPVLPTTPFLLLASACFVKSSARFQRWFQGTELYRKYLEEFVRSKSMTLRAKWMILIPVTAALITVFLLADVFAVRLVVVLALACKYFLFLFRIKTIAPSSSPQEQAREQDASCAEAGSHSPEQDSAEAS